MNTHALFGLSALMSFVASGVAANLYVWPRLRMMDRGHALVPVVAPHMFLRTIGLSFLVPGVVSPSLPAAFAVPAAYGDLSPVYLRSQQLWRSQSGRPGPSCSCGCSMCGARATY